jgi:hypothetical protein
VSEAQILHFSDRLLGLLPLACPLFDAPQASRTPREARLSGRPSSRRLPNRAARKAASPDRGEAKRSTPKGLTGRARRYLRGKGHTSPPPPDFSGGRNRPTAQFAPANKGVQFALMPAIAQNLRGAKSANRRSTGQGPWLLARSRRRRGRVAGRGIGQQGRPRGTVVGEPLADGSGAALPRSLIWSLRFGSASPARCVIQITA